MTRPVTLTAAVMALGHKAIGHKAIGLAGLVALGLAVAGAAHAVELQVAPPPGAAQDRLPEGGQLRMPPEKFLQGMAKNMSAILPRQINPVTTWERITAEGLTAVYHYRLSAREGTDAEMLALLRKTVVPDICVQPMMRNLIDTHGVTVRHEYALPGSTTPVTLEIDAAVCAKSQAAGQVGTDPVARKMQQTAAERNAETPRRMGPGIVLERVSAEGRMMVYHYRVSRPDSEGAAAVAAMRQQLVSTTCADPQLRRWFDTLGIVHRYSYVFGDSTAPRIVDVNAAACREADG